MKRKTIQPRVGSDGKYLSLFKREKRTWSSAESGIEKALRDFFSATRPSIAKTINRREKLALAIIEAEGYEVKKPYRFHDWYAHEKGGAILSSMIEIQIGTDEGSLTPLGRAAQILVECHDLRRSMEAGNVEKTAQNAMLLQNSVDGLLFSQYELAALVGASIVGNQNAKKFTDEDKQQWQNRFDELRLENPKLSKRRASEIIEAETGTPSETVRASLKK